MAITIFGVAASPADNVALSGTDPIEVVPPASMQSGDLVLVQTSVRSGVSALAELEEAGGQSWTAITGGQGGSLGSRRFWCRFNGTWSANPSWNFAGSGSACSVYMLVIRPNASTSIWEVDVANANSAYTIGSSPFTVTRNGVTTTVDGAIAVASFMSVDDNTWGNLTGTGWATLGDAYYRNAHASLQTSAAFAYKIQAAAGATGNVTLDQLTNGGDNGRTEIIAFREVVVANPEFTSAALTPTTDGFEADVEITEAATVYAVAVPIGSAAPNAAQIAAGNGADNQPALAAASKAVAADTEDQLVLTGIEYPLVDVHLAVGSDVESFEDEQKLPETGYQYVTAPAGPYSELSIWDEETETGNISVIPLVVAPSGASLSLDESGAPVLGSVVEGRQSFTVQEFDLSSADWIPVGEDDFYTYYLNAQPATETTPIPSQAWWTNVPIVPIILDDHFSHPDGDTLSYEFDPPLPDGLEVAEVTLNEGEEDERVVKQIQGTPAVDEDGDYTFDLAVEDEAGLTLNATPFAALVGVGVQVPDVEDNGTDYSTATELITDEELEVDELELALDGGVAPGDVISTTPTGGTWVAPGTVVHLVVSAVEVPDVEGDPLDPDADVSRTDAISAIESAGLNDVVTMVPSFAVADDHVIEQDPPAGTLLLLGSDVRIDVSSNTGLINRQMWREPRITIGLLL